MDKNLLCIFPRHEECHMRNQCTKYSTCPMVVVQNLLSGKWKLLILWYLSYGTLRFEYSLTEVGKEIIPILEMMHSFGSEYLDAGLLNTEEKDEDNTDLN